MINKIVFPAIGYLVVAITCGFAGYFSNPERAEAKSGDIVLLILLFGFLFPVYINRAILYEQKKHATESIGEYLPETQAIWGMRIGLPALIFVLASIPFLIILFGTDLKSQLDDVDHLDVLIKISAALSPAYLFGIWNSYGWQKDRRVYAFRYRSFFPALATCILPFVYGWAEPNETLSVSLAATCIISAWLISQWISTFRFSLIMLLAFAALMIASIVARTQAFVLPDSLASFLQVFSFGLLLTLVMGVSESWRVSTRTRDDVEYGPPGVYGQSDASLYLSGTNLATSLFFPFFLVTFLHPSTTYMYMALVLALLILQFALWFAFASNWTHEIWSKLGLAFGLSLPVIVVFGANFSMSMPFVNEALTIPDFFDVGGPITIFIGYVSYLVWLKLPLIGQILPEINIRYFLRVRPCLALTGLAASVALILISFGPPILESANNLGSMGDFLLARTRLLQLIYFFIVIVCACILFVRSNALGVESDSKAQDGSNADKSTIGSKPARTSVVNNLGLLVVSGRPTTSILVGFLTWLILALNTNLDPLASVGRIMPIILVTMIGFILNDIFDVEKDKDSQKVRPIVKGRLKIASAKMGLTYLCIAAVLLEGIHADLNSFIVIFIALLGVFLYSPFSHGAPVLKGLWTSILICTPLFYSEAISSIQMPARLYVALIAFVLGRELLMDVMDYIPDRRYGLKTLPYYLGTQKSVKIGSALMLISLLALIVLDVGSASSSVAMIALAATIWAIIVFRKDMTRSFVISRLALLLASVAAVTGV